MSMNRLLDNALPEPDPVPQADATLPQAPTPAASSPSAALTPEMRNWLLGLGPEVSEWERAWASLHEAVDQQDRDRVQALLAQTPQLRGPWKGLPVSKLFASACQSQTADALEILGLLLHQGGRGLEESLGRSLQSCAQEGFARALSVLVDYWRQGPVDALNTSPAASAAKALGVAAIHGHLECVQALLLVPKIERYAEHLGDGETALMKATKAGHAQCVRALLGQAPRAVNGFDWSALMIAADALNAEILQILMPVSDAQCAEFSGTTALMLAMKTGGEECMRILTGPSWNTDRQQKTKKELEAVHWAARVKEYGWGDLVAQQLPLEAAQKALADCPQLSQTRARVERELLTASLRPSEHSLLSTASLPSLPKKQRRL